MQATPTNFFGSLQFPEVTTNYVDQNLVQFLAFTSEPLDGNAHTFATGCVRVECERAKSRQGRHSSRLQMTNVYDCIYIYLYTAKKSLVDFHQIVGSSHIRYTSAQICKLVDALVG